ncbi:MAG: hypothetical protein APF80_15310 [Alphaproteobacteria bacterium BRH_c36]|nr:MAG: hypothetical protein APF80_15310 [Alphaproteobacteria bacterium BRH_c36]
MQRTWLSWAGAAALVAAISPTSLHALDDANPTGLITDTIANRERLRDYDNSKQYGAERVGDRTREYAQPDGVRAGNFFLFPSAETRIIYDDNIFASPTNTVDDIRTEILPSVEVKSFLPRHILNFAFDGRLVSFAENSDQDFADARARFAGALHVDHAHTLALSAMTELAHDERRELAATRLAAEPVPVHHSKVSAGLTRDVGRLFGTISATAERYDYYDVDGFDGGNLDQDYRDTDILSTQLRTGYRISPGFEAVAKLKLLRLLNGQSGPSNATATGYEALAGLAFQTSPLLRWRILGGYGIRDYDVASQETAGTGLLEAQVEWLPTERMTVYGSVSRDINDFSGEGFNGWVETSVKARVEYEIYNNLVLKLGANFAQADFEGIDRQDKIYSAEIGLEYFMNKNWLFTFSYEHLERLSSDDIFDMTDNRFMIGAKLKF